MKKIFLLLAIVLFTFVFALPSFAAPQLRYSHAGSFENWTEEAYYSSPAVIDLDGDGSMEIVFSNYSITVLDAATGAVKWKVNSGYDRNTPVHEFGLSNGHTWSDVEIHDINCDGKYEIITGHGHGVISVLDSNGYFLPGWPQRPLDASVRCVEVADLDGNGTKEIIAGYGVESNTSVYVFNSDGTLRSGWPQTRGNNGITSWTAGLYMDNITTGDLDGDGKPEIVVPSDLSFISVFEEDGSAVMANREVYGDNAWGHIAFFEDYSAEIRNENKGWGFDVDGTELREELYKAEFGHSKAHICDVDGNGSKEVVVSVLMCNRKYAPTYPPTEYMSVAILNADRTRYSNDYLGYNWESIPTDLGSPLVQNSESVTSNMYQSNEICDIDGDGKVEILFNSYNGKVHCFGLDKREPYAWPYSLTKRSDPEFEYASPVVCYDFNRDGKKEIVFTSYYDSTTNYGIKNGSLYILSHEGRPLSVTTLPGSKEAGRYSNGAMAAPVVCDIDGDGTAEIIVNTIYGAICVYDV